MEDAFSLFSLERRPLIDEAALKEKYLRLAAMRHPDLVDGDDEKFHLLQDAYKTLREPAARLRHLAELEFPGGGSQSESAPHAELFMSAGSAVQAAKAIFLRSEDTTTALARALLAPDIAVALQQVRGALQSIQQARGQLECSWRISTPAGLGFLVTSWPIWRHRLGFFRGGSPSCPNGNSA